MVTVQYRTDDGMVFSSRLEAQRHEANVANGIAFKQWLEEWWNKEAMKTASDALLVEKLFADMGAVFFMPRLKSPSRARADVFKKNYRGTDDEDDGDDED